MKNTAVLISYPTILQSAVFFIGVANRQRNANDLRYVNLEWRGYKLRNTLCRHPCRSLAMLPQYARISDIGFSLEWDTTRGRITNWGRTDEGVHIREKPMTTQGRIMKYQTDVTIGSLIQYPSKNEGYLPNNLIPYRYIGLVFHYSYVSWIRLLHSLSGSYQHISTTS